jgi:hypothetical protein
MIPQLVVRLVHPSDLINGGGRVCTVWTASQVELRVDDTAGVDPAVVAPLRRVLNEVLPSVPGGCPVMRIYVERAMPDDHLVTVEITPYQTDVHVLAGLLPEPIADEIAAHGTYLARHVRP